MGVKVRERKPGEWWLFIDYNGDRRAKKVGSKRAAVELAKDIEKKIAAAEFQIRPPEVPPGFKEYAENWMKGHVALNLKTGSIIAYRNVLDNHLYPIFGNLTLDAITRDAIRQLCSDKIEEGYAKESVKKMADVVSIVFNHAIEEGKVKFNPAARPGKFLKTARMGEKAEFLTPEEGRAILAEAKKRYARNYYPLFLTAIRTGMRIGEILGLQWGDMDWRGGFIEVRRNSYFGKIDTPKNGKIRRVDMSNQLSDVLQEYRRTQAAQALKDGRPMSEWVFPNSEGGVQRHPAIVRKYLGFTLKHAGIRHVPFHTFRHTFASWLIANGESLAYIRDQMGHHSIRVTVDLYGHLVPGANRKAVNQMDDPDWQESAKKSATQAQPKNPTETESLGIISECV